MHIACTGRWYLCIVIQRNQGIIPRYWWFTATFNDANSVIKLNDKELGTIIAQGYVANIVTVSAIRYHYSAWIGTIIAHQSVPKRCKVLLMYNNNRLSLQKNFKVTLERSGSEQRWKALKALNPFLTAFRKSRPKIKAACNDSNTTQNYVHSFHNYFFFKMLSANSAKKIVENNPTPNSKA